MAERVTISEIAKQSSVSPRAVSYALNGKSGVSEATRQRIQAIANELGYRPNAAARSMRSAKTGHVGVLVRNDDSDRLTHLMAFETILGINQGLEDRGYVLSLVRIGDVREGLATGSRVFTEQVLDGLLVFCEMPDRLDRKVQKLIPNVVWIESQSWSNQYCLRRDEEQAGRLCAEQMIELGYRELVWIGHPGTTKANVDMPAYSAPMREHGVRSAAEAARVPVRSFELAYDDSEAWRRTPALISSLGASTAVIAGQAYQARWLKHAATSLGLNPPYDFGLCCCDDGYDVTSMWPGLSRVSFDRYGMGLAAAKMMCSRLEHPDRECPSQTIAGHWVPGNSAWGPMANRRPRPTHI